MSRSCLPHICILQYLHPEGMDMEWQLRLQFCCFQFWARFPILRSQRGSKGVKYEKQENIDKKKSFFTYVCWD